MGLARGPGRRPVRPSDEEGGPSDRRRGGRHPDRRGAGCQAHAGAAQAVDPIQYLSQHGYTAWTSYQPDSRYWTFQWIEFGWLAVLSLLLLGATLWLVRRRAG